VCRATAAIDAPNTFSRVISITLDSPTHFYSATTGTLAIDDAGFLSFTASASGMSVNAGEYLSFNNTNYANAFSLGSWSASGSMSVTISQSFSASSIRGQMIVLVDISLTLSSSANINLLADAGQTDSGQVKDNGIDWTTNHTYSDGQ
jgi:hypothetical protein